MNALQHPMLVHLPISAVILLPLLLLFAFYLEKKDKNIPQIWYIVSGLLVMSAVSASLAVLTGGIGEEIVEKAVPKSIVEQHEEWGEIFAILIYLTAFLSIVHLFVKDPLRKIARIGLLVLSFLLLGVGAQTGRLGGELVYKHNAASILIKKYGNSGGSLASENKSGTYKKKAHGDHDDKDRDHDDD